MSNHEPGSQPVTLLLGNVPVSTLNPLPTTGGGGGGGGVVTQGAGSGIPTGAWTTRLSNGTAFYNALTDAELRASAVAVSAAALPLPTGAATEATLLNVDANLTDIQTQQIDGTQRSRITDGTNNAAVSNTAPTGIEYGLAVRPVFALPTVAPRTYFTLISLTLTQIATASTTIKGRIIYNNGSAVVYIGLGSTIISAANPAATSTFPLRDSVGVYRLYTDSPSEDPATMSCHVNAQLPSGSTAVAVKLQPIEISVVDGGLTYVGYKLQFVNLSSSGVDVDCEVVIERH